MNILQILIDKLDNIPTAILSVVIVFIVVHIIYYLCSKSKEYKPIIDNMRKSKVYKALSLCLYTFLFIYNFCNGWLLVQILTIVVVFNIFVVLIHYYIQQELDPGGGFM